jgi:hypothetical protein
LKSGPNNPNNAKIQTIILSSLFWSKLVSKDAAIFGNFLVSKNHNEPTKSSLIFEKIAQFGHPRVA